MSRPLLLPALAIALALAAASTMIVLQQRAAAHYHTQISLIRAENDLNAVQPVPWLLENPRAGTPQRLHASMLAIERRIETTVRGLKPAEAASILAPARRNFAVLERIFRIGLRPTGWDTPTAVTLLAGETKTLSDATARVEAASTAEGRAARNANREASLGAVGAMLLLCAGFLYYHRRSIKLGRARARTVARLEAAETERTRLLARTVEVAEHERIRLAIELHDGPIQRLTALAFNLDMLARRIERGKVDNLDAPVAKVRESLATEMAALRRLMVELRPPVIDERGIVAALEDAAAGALEGSSTGWAVIGDFGALHLAPELETGIYRVVREALLNTRRHADASFVEVRLFVVDDETIGVAIRDDGCGFQPGEGTRRADGTQFGLVGMEERIGGLGGRFELQSAPGEGTRIELRLPAKAAKEVTAHELVAA